MRSILVAIMVAFAIGTSSAAEPPFLKQPYTQNVTTTSAVVMWETKEPVEYKLTWSTGGKEVGGKGGRIEEDDQYKLKVGEIRIEGLKPNTIYKYTVEIGGRKAGGAFQTFPDRETPCRFIVYSDTQDTFKGAAERHRKFTRLFAKKNPRLILHCGDLLDVGGRYSSWSTAHFGPLEGLAENVPTYPALGNHEYNGSPAWYYKFHSLPGNERWYSFDFSNVHFICLDSEVYQLEELKGQAAEQLRWLEADLKASKARWKVVYFHHLVYNSGVFGGMVPLRRKWAPLFEKGRRQRRLQRTQPLLPQDDADKERQTGPRGRYLFHHRCQRRLRLHRRLSRHVCFGQGQLRGRGRGQGHHENRHPRRGR